ncbi:hypothetical protein NPIL_616281 [Nephila pilipes]|uniref:Uncharacterized protein n=1 Tax=Nephila pilipes TaxID=299642 RepID=A0A8X6P8U3_NEPPI|nr:hypothetical protein NPIL_616281 [Nephila pilipes]
MVHSPQSIDYYGRRGPFTQARPDTGRPRNVRTPQKEETVLQRFTDCSPTSTQTIAAELYVPHTEIRNALDTAKM